MNKPSIGAAVKYYVSGQVHDAIVVGFDPQAEDAKGLPAASLAFFNPAKSIHLSGAEWAHSFERVDSVPHADETRFSWYIVPEFEKTISDMQKGINILRDQLKEKADALEAVANKKAKKE